MKKDVSWCFIVNPAAGRGKVARRWNRISTSLKAAGICFEAVFTSSKFHAADLARQAIEQGCRHLVAVGGDGTAHEVVNGIFTQPFCSTQEITFSLLPVGTGNDWIKMHGISKDLKTWIRQFVNGHTAHQDVGLITYQEDGCTNTRYFINVAGLSFDGFVAKKSTHKSSVLPSGLFYLSMTAICLFQYKTPEFHIQFNGRKFSGRFLTVNAGICRYSGGGMQLVPHALPDDGKIALTVAGPIGITGALLSTPLFYTGKLNWHPGVNLYQTEKVTIDPKDNKPVWVEADGEFLGMAPTEITIKKAALRILVP